MVILFEFFPLYMVIFDGIGNPTRNFDDLVEIYHPVIEEFANWKAWPI